MLQSYHCIARCAFYYVSFSFLFVSLAQTSLNTEGRLRYETNNVSIAIYLYVKTFSD